MWSVPRRAACLYLGTGLGPVGTGHHRHFALGKDGEAVPRYSSLAEISEQCLAWIMERAILFDVVPFVSGSPWRGPGLPRPSPDHPR